MDNAQNLLLHTPHPSAHGDKHNEPPRKCPQTEHPRHRFENNSNPQMTFYAYQV